MSKLKVDELEESTSGQNITVASGTNLVVTDSLTVGGAAPYTAGGTDVPITDGGTGASSATAAASALGVGTEDSPQFTAVNVGHASDTTLARASAGDISVEGNTVYRAGGTDVAVADGGTGASTATAGFDALAPMTTVGDIMYGGSSGTGTRLAASTDGHVLTATGAGSAPAWEALPASGGKTVKVTHFTPSNWGVNDFNAVATTSPTVDITMTSGNRIIVMWSSGVHCNRISWNNHAYAGISGTEIPLDGNGNPKSNVLSAAGYRLSSAEAADTHHGSSGADVYWTATAIVMTDVINATSASFSMKLFGGSGESGYTVNFNNQCVTCIEIDQT